MREEHRFEELVFNVLGYREEGEWVALALEMDLRAFGQTFEAALEELAELVEMKISFAIQKQQPEMIWRRAAQEYFALYEKALRNQVEALYFAHDDHESASLRIAGVPIPPAHVIAANREGFHLANG
ncbi:MAG: hypothetical protein HC897_15795 [Thermoanaerobaculia bacterium]|nr:hypothetical protein [Thermoanaerobaculia bacterium]